jgi:hypothetical protein
MKTKTIGLGVLISVAAAAMCFASNPTLGTWKLNESKSTFGDGAGKSTLVVWEKVGDQHKCADYGSFHQRKVATSRSDDYEIHYDEHRVVAPSVCS